MTEQEIGQELKDIRKGMKLFDTMIHAENYETGEAKITEKQVEILRKLFKLFETLNWQIAFDSYKTLTFEDSKAIDTRECGKPVKIRSCKKEHGEKTYFGVLIGDVALSVSHSIDDAGNITGKHAFYNPAIFVPELHDIVYGCESFWGEIESEEELGKLITDETIKNVWYVKALAAMTKGAD